MFKLTQNHSRKRCGRHYCIRRFSPASEVLVLNGRWPCLRSKDGPGVVSCSRSISVRNTSSLVWNAAVHVRCYGGNLPSRNRRFVGLIVVARADEVRRSAFFCAQDCYAVLIPF